MRPDISLGFSAKLIKDKLYMDLSWSNLFNLSSIDRSKYYSPRVNQNNIYNNRSQNVSFSLTYIFGKTTDRERNEMIVLSNCMDCNPKPRTRIASWRSNQAERFCSYSAFTVGQKMRRQGCLPKTSRRERHSRMMRRDMGYCVRAELEEELESHMLNDV